MKSAMVVTWLCIGVILVGLGWAQTHKEPRPTYHHADTFSLCVDPDQYYSFELHECFDRPAVPVKQENPIVWIANGAARVSKEQE